MKKERLRLFDIILGSAYAFPRNLLALMCKKGKGQYIKYLFFIEKQINKLQLNKNIILISPSSPLIFINRSLMLYHYIQPEKNSRPG